MNKRHRVSKAWYSEVTTGNFTRKETTAEDDFLTFLLFLSWKKHDFAHTAILLFLK